jgi:hypothetical protein
MVALSNSSSAWLAYGELRGNLQPCGCDPLTDLGGVRRIGTLLNRERSAAKEIMVFDLANNFLQPPHFDLSSKFLNQALDQFVPTATLLHPAELPYLHKYNAKRPLVLSNQQRGRQITARLDCRESISTKNMVVLGYFWQEAYANTLLKWGTELKHGWEKLLAAHQGKTAVLLFSGPRSHLQEIVAAKMFTHLISSSDKPADKTFDEGEKQDSRNLLSNEGPPAVYMVPLGGAGVLRGGTLRAGEAPSLSQMVGADKGASILQTPQASQLGASSLPLSSERIVSWLDKSYEDGSPLAGLLAAYEKESAQEFKSKEKFRLTQIKHSKFVGAEPCRACHAAAYEQWSKSKHAHAYTTLEKAGKGENAVCVSCHVLGLNEAGGFVSVKATPHFAHVQCENCHGARKEHIANPTQHKGVKGEAFAKCGSCHNSVHSPQFEKDKYWNLIKH